MNMCFLFSCFAGSVIGEFHEASKECVDIAVQSAKEALGSWKKLTGFERGKVLKKAADIIRVSSTFLAHSYILCMCAQAESIRMFAYANVCTNVCTDECMYYIY